MNEFVNKMLHFNHIRMVLSSHREIYLNFILPLESCGDKIAQT